MISRNRNEIETTFDSTLNNDGIFIGLPSRAIKKGNHWELHEIAVSNHAVMEQKKFIFSMLFAVAYSFEFAVAYRSTKLFLLASLLKACILKQNII